MHLFGFREKGTRTEKRKNYTTMELFARCDGLSCSFGQPGFSVVFPVKIDRSTTYSLLRC